MSSVYLRRYLDQLRSLDFNWFKNIIKLEDLDKIQNRWQLGSDTLLLEVKYLLQLLVPYRGHIVSLALVRYKQAVHLPFAVSFFIPLPSHIAHHPQHLNSRSFLGLGTHLFIYLIPPTSVFCRIKYRIRSEESLSN